MHSAVQWHAAGGIYSAHQQGFRAVVCQQVKWRCSDADAQDVQAGMESSVYVLT